MLNHLCPHRLVRPRISRPQREDRGSNPLGDATLSGFNPESGEPVLLWIYLGDSRVI